MPNTPRLALPYPQDTDPASDGAANIGALALAVEAAMPRVLAIIDATGDSSAGAAEAIDSATAPHTFVAVAGRTYEVRAQGQGVMSTVAGDSAYVRLRAAAGAAVAVASPVIQTLHVPNIVAAGTGGKASLPALIATLRCGPGLDIAAGQVTVGLFRARNTGTGNITLSAPAGGRRQLVVEDKGVS